MRDPYEILEISGSSSEEEIKKAYKKLALQHHPDRFSVESEKKVQEEKFKEINEAYQAICNNKHIDSQFQKFNMNDFFGGMGSPFDFSTFNFDFFRNHFERENSKRRDPNNIILNLTLTFNEVLQGVTKEFEVVDIVDCKKCSGNPFKNKKQCDSCMGTGATEIKKRNGNSLFITRMPCKQCSGNGFTAEEVCDLCKGTGINKINKKYKLNIQKAEEISEKEN
jgi:molecular chaperone DnaJ